MAQPSYIAETKIVRQLAANIDCEWQWSRHFFDEASAEDPPILQPDVEHALKFGTVIFEEHKKDVLWRVRGKDLDGRSITAVVAVFEKMQMIRVVTVWVQKK